MQQEQFTKIIGWQEKTFPNATVLSKLSHLEEEIDEVAIAVSFKSSNMSHEFADALMLLYGAAAKAGLTYTELCIALDEKMAINERRKWGTPEKNGVVHHEKPDAHTYHGSINRLSELYETAKDLVIEITPHDGAAFKGAEKLRGILIQMRDMAAFSLQKNKTN